MTRLEQAKATRAQPTFSIVMPAYNTEPTVAAAIESVLAQTREDFELIVVDDGSTDGTAERVRQFLADNRMKLISQPNLGHSRARNVAISASTGRLVSFLDSDDLWLPDYLDVMAATLDEHPEAAVAYTDAWVLYDEMKQIARGTAMARWQPPAVPDEPHAFLAALLENGNFVYTAVTARRPVLVAVGGFRESLHAAVDYEFWLRIAAHGHRFVRCAQTLAVYRRRGGQVTADPATVQQVLPEVFRLVSEEYEVPEEIRRLARRRAREQEILLNRSPRPGRPRRPPPGLRRAYRILWRLRRFYVRPPAEVRHAFPDLQSV